MSYPTGPGFDPDDVSFADLREEAARQEFYDQLEWEQERLQMQIDEDAERRADEADAAMEAATTFDDDDAYFGHEHD